MSPEELQTHNKPKTTIVSTLYLLNQELNLGELYSDRVFVTHKDAELSTEPDGTFVSWKTLRSGAVTFKPRADRGEEFIEVQGSPDWILEVISRSSGPKDLKQLRKKYHAADVSEYWLVDALGKKANLQILYREDTGYVAAPVISGWQHSRVFNRHFKLTRRRGRMKLWIYRLEVKE